MSGFDYTKLKGSAQRLLKRFGKPAVIVREEDSGGGGGDPWDPGSGTVEVEHPCRIVTGSFEQSLIDGSRVQANDLQVTLSTEGLTITPTTADKLKIGDTSYSIIACHAVEPGEVVLLYRLQIRD
ncbi:hypothetical protein [Roseibium sp. RKSG952]|uniref:hypothetical protein n=1 Tax=Roseibium sp. RKSG952 TaxID=2529384 RepID=UPI0012BCBD5C|nr:hypothetical protein [Roseibium sp. RKSG952]MTH96416.1 hypothetical protein [Roseibium sp. RKSG952]